MDFIAERAKGKKKEPEKRAKKSFKRLTRVFLSRMEMFYRRISSLPMYLP